MTIQYKEFIQFNDKQYQAWLLDAINKFYDTDKDNIKVFFPIDYLLYHDNISFMLLKFYKNLTTLDQKQQFAMAIKNTLKKIAFKHEMIDAITGLFSFVEYTQLASVLPVIKDILIHKDFNKLNDEHHHVYYSGVNTIINIVNNRTNKDLIVDVLIGLVKSDNYIKDYSYYSPNILIKLCSIDPNNSIEYAKLLLMKVQSLLSVLPDNQIGSFLNKIEKVVSEQQFKNILSLLSTQINTPNIDTIKTLNSIDIKNDNYETQQTIKPNKNSSIPIKTTINKADITNTLNTMMDLFAQEISKESING